MGETLNGKDKIQFRTELFLALIIAGLACAAGFSNILSMSNSTFPSTSDAMGHMAKVRYLAECLARGEFPSWFPFWYNGSTVTQYYPPLSYWIMAFIYIPVQNAMLTFKIYSFAMIFVGGMGVWYFCRTFIGRWCGLFGTVAFCIQPYILRSLLSAGTVAQGPIIALSSWYLITLLRLGEKTNSKHFFLSTVICALMILGHPNTAFMMCLCILAAFFILVITKIIRLDSYCYILMTIIFAGILTAFWSLVGATGLENPGIPYLLVEAALNYTADISWYTTWESGFFFFAIPVTIGSFIAGIILIYRISKKKADKSDSYYVSLSLLLTLITIVFSFGLNLPLFKYLPLAESLVPGRILGLTSATGAILCSYVLFRIVKAAVEKKRMGIRLAAYALIVSMIGIAAYYMNPLVMHYEPVKDNFSWMPINTGAERGNFEKGRYSYLTPVDCSETYFPLSQGFNISDGWNIEGTTQNRTIWNFIIADSSGCDTYIAKSLAYWNVRQLLLSKDYFEVAAELNSRYHFRFAADREGNGFYSSDDPSSYFLTDHRNALIFGDGAPGAAIEFPYLIYDQRNDITDYTIEELEKYKLIYLCEPEVKTLQDKDIIENMVKELIDRGVTVMIEPTIAQDYALFDVTAADVNLEDAPAIRKQPDSEISSTVDNIYIDESMKFGRAIFGLDHVYYKLIQNDGRLENDIIGTKRAGNGEVIFIGEHLSQYLKAVYARNWGVPKTDSGYPECTDEIKTLFEDIFTTYGVDKNFWPDSFPTKNADWTYKGVNFEYSSTKAQEMTLSVTYTPRWKASLDGKPIPVGQRENLVTLDLPAGDHEVKLVYGLTKYGIAGYIISLAGLLLFILFLRFYDIILYQFRQISSKIDNFLQKS
jgi:hypothetical protein